jgi:hypothetical protein
MPVFIVTLVFKTVIYISKLLVLNTSQASKTIILNQTPTLWMNMGGGCRHLQALAGARL